MNLPLYTVFYTSDDELCYMDFWTTADMKHFLWENYGKLCDVDILSRSCTWITDDPEFKDYIKR